MVKIPVNILRASRGMSKIALEAKSMSERAFLAYFGLYACGYSGRGSLDKFSSLDSALIDTAFLSSVLEKNLDQISISDWIVTGWNDDRVFLKRNKLRVFISRSYLNEETFVKGKSITLQLPSLISNSSSGFIVRYGAESCAGQNISRLYLNIRPTSASWALGTLVNTLNMNKIPFEIKVLAHPRAYIRRDACVVYVPSIHLGKTVDIIQRAILKDLIPLSSPVPLFTKKLDHGLGFADEPSDTENKGQSHGQWASNLFMLASENLDNSHDIAIEVIKRLRDMGRDPNHPYLRAERSVSDLNFFSI